MLRFFLLLLPIAAALAGASVVEGKERFDRLNCLEIEHRGVVSYRQFAAPFESRYGVAEFIQQCKAELETNADSSALLLAMARYLYLSGDADQAFSRLEEAKELGNAEATYWIGKVLFETGGREEAQRGLQMLEGSARAGEGYSSLLLGSLYMAGIGVEKDCSKATSYLRNASKSAAPEANLLLGLSHLNGTCGKANREAGLALMRQSAAAGLPMARFIIAFDTVMRAGEGDLRRGLDELEALSRSGLREATERLFYLYHDGTRVPQDADKALTYYCRLDERSAARILYPELAEQCGHRGRI